jgi:hypothetical protein
MMLSIIESVVDEANVEVDAASPGQDSAHLPMILEKLGNPVYQQAKHKKAAKAMTRILPFLTYGAEKTSAALVDFFKPHLDLEKFKEGESFYVEGFEDVAANIKQDTNGQKLREFIVEHGKIFPLAFLLLFFFFFSFSSFSLLKITRSSYRVGVVEVFLDYIERHGPPTVLSPPSPPPSGSSLAWPKETAASDPGSSPDPR